ncbi:hypothetical protein ACFYVL_01295 [Streptomyces sp. NPDC004111]|uniref:hypothetical protein n=1 Tax=Streptomyces sp. NPDC004111 TaxID=3364690 RepID=UPI0036CE902C
MIGPRTRTAALTRHIVRATAWRPMTATALLIPVVAAVLLLMYDEHLMPPQITANLLRATAVLLATAAGTLLADPTVATTAAVPSPRFLRQTMRLALAVTLVALVWALTSWLLITFTPPLDPGTLSGLAQEALALTLITLTGTAWRTRHHNDPTAPLVGLGLTLVFLTATAPLRGDWSLWATPGTGHWDAVHAGWTVLAVAAALVLAPALGDTYGRGFRGGRGGKTPPREGLGGA